MKIGIFLHPYSQNKGGLERYVYETARALVVLDQEHEYLIYIDKDTSPHIEWEGANWKVVPHSYNGIFWKVFANVSEKSDVYIFFTPLVPLLHRFKRNIVVFFDAAFLYFGGNGFKQRMANWLQLILQTYGMMRATRVVAISQASKNDAVEKMYITEEKVRVIYCGYTRVCDAQKPTPVTLPEKRFFLYIGPCKERKNVKRILEAFLRVCESTEEEVNFVMAGRHNEVEKADMYASAAAVGLGHRIVFPGYVSDSELAYLYSRAVGFVFPSLLEGFGLPVLEAMNCGCPVITSNISSLPEVAGDAALLVDPYNVEAIASAMLSLLKDENLVDSLKEKGYKRAQQFGWSHSAKQWKEIIQAIEQSV